MPVTLGGARPDHALHRVSAWHSALRPADRPGKLNAEDHARSQPGAVVPRSEFWRFITLGAQSPGVGIGFLQLGAPAVQAWADPGRIGGFEINVPVLTVRAYGQRYYLAGFAYPLAGTLNLFVAGNSASPVHYLVPTRLSRPRGPGVWQGTG